MIQKFHDALKELIRAEVRFPIVDRASFIRNKRASSRKKDIGDLELLGADEEST